jgi:acyl dehydratase
MALGLLTQLDLFEGTILAFAGIENWRFTVPMMIGDTIHVIARVARAKETRKPDRGIVAFYMDVRNQKDISVMSGEITTMMLRRKSKEGARR